MPKIPLEEEHRRRTFWNFVLTFILVGQIAILAIVAVVIMEARSFKWLQAISKVFG